MSVNQAGKVTYVQIRLLDTMDKNNKFLKRTQSSLSVTNKGVEVVITGRGGSGYTCVRIRKGDQLIRR